MSDNDQAVEALVGMKLPHTGALRHPHLGAVEARAILDAIRNGEVPGIVTDDMIQTTKLMVYESALEEIAALRAEVGRLKVICEDAHRHELDAMKREAEANTRYDKAMAEVADLKRELQKDWEANCCDLMADAQREKARADKAEAEVESVNATWKHHQAEREQHWYDRLGRADAGWIAEKTRAEKAEADRDALTQTCAEYAGNLVKITAERDRLAGLLNFFVDRCTDVSPWREGCGCDVCKNISEARRALAEVGK